MMRSGMAGAVGAMLFIVPALFAGCAAVEEVAIPMEGSYADLEDAALASTYSIVAVDKGRGEFGVGVQSRYFGAGGGVGGVVPWVEAQVGAIATQSYANVRFGPEGLAMLRAGKAAAEALKVLIDGDEGRDRRQVGIVDAEGRAATYTGSGCIPWAGGRTGDGYTVQGNILVGEETVDAMAKAYEASAGEPLAERLMRALEAGQKAGGDIRGRQSSSLHVVRRDGGRSGGDRVVWLQVEDHPDPIRELRRLLDKQHGRDPLSRARAARREGKIDEARDILRQGEKLEPNDPWYPFALAEIEIEAGDRAAAAAAIERAIACDPAYDNLYYHAAALQFRAGDADGAIARLRRLIELNPAYRARLRWEAETPGNRFSAHRQAIEAAGILAER